MGKIVFPKRRIIFFTRKKFICSTCHGLTDIDFSELGTNTSEYTKDDWLHALFGLG